MISPIMGTVPTSLSSALFGRVRSSVLSLLFCHSDTSFYFREIERSVNMGRGAVQRELENLVNAGLVVRRKQGNHVYFQANPKSAIFPELRSLMVKTAGIADILRQALAPLSERITFAFIYGSFAKGTETADSDVDVLFVGEAKLSEIVDLLMPAQQIMGREVNPSVYPLKEFSTKIAGGHHFLTSVVRDPKIFLIGDENVFRGLVEKRLAG
ncbi:putative nucleotidyltransferase [Desulfomonile tiedjei DSM 6799]|uniref:Putative nucleotidyltransferase n=2 Tax=Desulfomonile tiedjei TaxID=2358 RepID=I4CC44_DESTA|nr:putative nucleotidyltransferase [Desulfomonile tiedjei DSM 6799]